MGLEKLFWSEYYEKDASLLAQNISLELRKCMASAGEEVSKLQKMQLAINYGVKTLRQTLCKDCISKLNTKISRLLESNTANRGQKSMIRLPTEQRKFIKELESLLIQKEMSKQGSNVDEQYVTTDEWYEQEIKDQSVQHDIEIKELQRERDTLKKEVNDLKKLTQELMDHHKKEKDQLQKTIKGNEIRIETYAQTIANNEKERKADLDRIERLQMFVKTKDNQITELTRPNEKKSTQREIKREKETKSASWFSFGGGSRKEEQKASTTENRKLLSVLHKAQEEDKQAELNLQLACSAQSEVNELRNENANLAENLREQKEKFEHVRLAKERLASDIQSILQEKASTETTLHEKVNELTSVHSQLEILYTEKKTLIDDLQKKTKELKTEKKQLDDSREEIKQMRRELSEQEKELRILREHMEVMRQPRKKSIVMGLHCNRSGLGKTLVDMVVRELTKGVQDRLDSNNINLTIQFSQTPSEVTSWLKVVLCLNMSRVGTNIMDVLKEMKGDRDVFVLVLHHTNKANLSSLTPTSHRISGSEFRQLGGILDMAFSSDSGLYECDLNSYSIDKITSVLKKYIII